MDVVTVLAAFGSAGVLLLAAGAARGRWLRRRHAVAPGASAAPAAPPIAGTTASRRDPVRAALAQAHLDRMLVRVARGAAHDLNNLLTVISGQARCIIGGSDATSHVQRALRIQEAADSAVGLTRRLLDLDRPHRSEPLELRRFVEDLAPVLRLLAGGRVQLELAPGPDQALVAMDHVSLGQVLMNLVVNAGQATPAGGTVTVASGLAADRSRAELSVRDTGVGMTPDTLQRAFEPFFTTKRDGNGLGLSVCKELVESVGGTVQVQSAPARGTTVVVQLPLAAPGAAAGSGAAGA